MGGCSDHEFRDGLEPKLLRGANAAHGGSAVRALPLGDGLAVLRDALNGVLHDLLRLALHAIRLDSHSYLQCHTGHRPISPAVYAVYQRDNDTLLRPLPLWNLR